jgi:hypothetical protein
VNSPASVVAGGLPIAALWGYTGADSLMAKAALLNVRTAIHVARWSNMTGICELPI